MKGRTFHIDRTAYNLWCSLPGCHTHVHTHTHTAGAIRLPLLFLRNGHFRYKMTHEIPNSQTENAKKSPVTVSLQSYPGSSGKCEGTASSVLL